MSIYKYDSTQDELIPLAGGTLYADAPIGSIFAYGGSNPVDGFLLCQGQAVSRTTYTELFSVIGTSFGSGDGTTTFNLPDMRETVPVGVGENDVQTIANHDVYTLGEFKDDQIQNIGKMKANATNGYSVVSGGIAGYITSNSALRTGTTTHGKQLGVNYIIKAKQTGVPVDIQSAIEEQNSYSTEETYTGKVWIDGKKIYRKVIPVSNVGSISSGGTKIVSFSRTANNVKDVTFAQCMMKNSAGYDYPNFAQVVAVDGDGIRLQWLSGGALTTGNVIIEYTKTT